MHERTHEHPRASRRSCRLRGRLPRRGSSVLGRWARRKACTNWRDGWRVPWSGDRRAWGTGSHGDRLAGGSDDRTSGISGAGSANRAGQAVQPGFAHLALVVDDIDALLVRIAAYGWKPQGIPQPIASGARAGTRVIYAVGPDGATIEFMQPPSSVQDL
ncbi:VOC family protein [Aureimonas sp. N4]|uniref:VOC family protein n=1 Tax=Aureimonas sp. N4 TaxID=1638165 RepID=UPI001FCD512E|nr:VOC family protein [Aureimonas sp. N4]